MSSISLTAGDKSNVFSNVMLRFLAKVHRNNLHNIPLKIQKFLLFLITYI